MWMCLPRSTGLLVDVLAEAVPVGGKNRERESGNDGQRYSFKVSAMDRPNIGHKLLCGDGFVVVRRSRRSLICKTVTRAVSRNNDDLR
jgi:hypothetical protein